jgi:uncharacterized protein involved in type VI secretion and phage assembly
MIEEGVVIAIVTGIDSDKKQIKVNFPWRNPDDKNKDEMVARLASTSKNPTLPQVNDQVLVAFEQGRFDRPIVIGVIWS